MFVTQIVRCPDCGSMAQRHFQVGMGVSPEFVSSSDDSQVTARTECHDCDYFLEICMTTGQVLASHIAPVFQTKQKRDLRPTSSTLAESIRQLQPS